MQIGTPPADDLGYPRSVRAPAASFAVVFLLACCATQPPRQALDADAIGAVQSEIKRQVGVYMREARKPVTVRKNGVEVPVSPSDFMCGNGEIDFEISSIKAELLSTTEITQDVGVAFKIPIAKFTVGPTAETKPVVTNTQLLTYNLWPVEDERQNRAIFEKVPSESEAPIARVLLELRKALILSAMSVDYSQNVARQKPAQPCFRDYNPQKPSSDAGNSFKLGLIFINDIKRGFEIKVGVVDLTATSEWKGTSGNTLTVLFVQRGLRAVQLAKDRVDAECKYPNAGTEKCKAAMEALQEAESHRGVGFR